MKSRGITLIEIVVVIAIIGVLSGIVAVLAGPELWKSRTRPTCASNLKGLVAALHLYVADYDDTLSTDRAWDVYTPLEKYRPVTSCPLVKDRKYHAATTLAYRGFNYGPKHFTRWPDGTPLPEFDFQRDVLFRCLFHGSDGWSFHPKQMLGTGDTRGKVMGVRWDGSVSQVSPVSCWQVRGSQNPPMWRFFELNPMYKTCDRRQ